MPTPSRVRLTCIATSLAVTFALVVPVGAGASAGAASLRAQPSDAVCEAAATSYSVEIVLAFLAGFVEAFEDLGSDSKDRNDKTGTTDSTEATTTTSTPLTAEELASYVRLIFSPKLEQVTGTLAEAAPKPIRKLFAQQRAVYADGVDLLEDAGVTKKQIKALAEIDITANTDAEELADDTSISKAEFDAAAKKFESRVKDLDLTQEATPAQEKAYQELGSDCGIFPMSGLDCDVLVSRARVEELVGPAETENDDGTCDYTATVDDGADTPELAVEVYPNMLAFDRLVEPLKNAEKISNDAYAVESFVTPGSFGFKTCGKTLYARANSRTVVVAYCPPGDGEVDVDELVDIADAASASLDA